ncbi:MAG: hypothetical protein ACE361_22095 [Aureliella sp.]
MLIAFGIVGGLFLLVAFFFLAVHPLVCMVECGLSKHFSGGKKILWITITFFTGIIGSAIYTLFVTKSHRLRKTSKMAFGTGALSFALAAGLGFMSPEVKAYMTPDGDAGQFASFEGFDDEAMDKSMSDFKDAMNKLEAMAKDLETSEGELSGKAIAEVIDGETGGRASAALESAIESWNANAPSSQEMDTADLEQEVFVSAGAEASDAQSILEATTEFSRSQITSSEYPSIDETLGQPSPEPESESALSNVFQLFDSLSGSGNTIPSSSPSTTVQPTPSVKSRASEAAQMPTVNIEPEPNSSRVKSVDTRQQSLPSAGSGTRSEPVQPPIRNRYLEQSNQHIYIVPADKTVRNRYLGQ